MPRAKFPIFPLGFAEVLGDVEQYPWNLSCLLYRGSLKKKKPYRMAAIASGEFGLPRMQRLPLVRKIHELIESDLAKGGSPVSLESRLRALLPFFAFCDNNNIDPTLDVDVLRNAFVTWIEDIRINRNLASATIFYSALAVGKMLAYAIGRKTADFITWARIKAPAPKPQVAALPELERLQLNTVSFAHFLIDISHSLTTDTIFGVIPITINFRDNRSHELFDGRRHRHPRDSDGTPRRVQTNFRPGVPGAHQATYLHVYAINLRIEAEMLLFIAQTGMNLAQASKSLDGDFSYTSHNDGYAMRRRYKGRRQGDVEFDIFSEYRPHFEAYRRWRSEIVGTTDARLFPLIGKHRAPNRASVEFTRSRKIARQLDVAFVSSKKLRGFRINWLLDKSQNPVLVAQMAQHDVRVLLSTYQRSSEQELSAHLAQFWELSDPSLSPAAPGACVLAVPTPYSDLPESAPTPDCIGAGGCFFCVHHRDIESFDYVWSILSFRYLKSLELSQQRLETKQPLPAPAQIVIERLTKKLEAMSGHNAEIAAWVKEAQARVKEGDFHLDWSTQIELAELV